MAAKKKARANASSQPPRIHEATLAAGASGVVYRGREIDPAQAVAERQAGRDIVVCGDDVDANRRAAFAIESAVGPCIRHDPHWKAGPHALPHYHQKAPPPEGHAFYETGSRQRKARRQP
jgi:hypothetical protein